MKFTVLLKDWFVWASTVALIIFGGIGVCIAAGVDIQANNSDGPIAISANETLTLSIGQVLDEEKEQYGDYWILAVTPEGLYNFNLFKGWLPGLEVTYQGPVLAFPMFSFFSVSGLSGWGMPPGRYLFLFGTDKKSDAQINFDSLIYDGVEVNISEVDYDSNPTVCYDDSPFGFHYAKELENYASDLGAKWVRVNAVWDLIQKKEDIIAGNFDWDSFESITKINFYPKDTNFMITLSVLGTPIAQSDSYILNEGSYSKENWIKYTKAVVNKYKNKVKYFQVENEPKPIKRNYAELQKITYNAIKEECPQCQVIMGGVFWAKGDINEWDRLNNNILIELNGQYVDIFDQHYYGDASEYNPIIFLDHVKLRLSEANFNNIPIWITEMGDYSGDPIEKNQLDPPYQSEATQAQGLFKRYISSLSYGVNKIFWAYGLYEGFKNDETYFDFTGLIYDGKFNSDLGYGIKKLSYYTYKKMTETLEGSDWDNIETIQNSKDVYVYKFTNKETGKPTWVAWSDSGTGIVQLSSLGIKNAKVIESVPDYTNGKEIIDNNIEFSDMFKEYTTINSIQLSDLPIFIEENNQVK